MPLPFQPAGPARVEGPGEGRPPAHSRWVYCSEALVLAAGEQLVSSPRRCQPLPECPVHLQTLSFNVQSLSSSQDILGRGLVSTCLFGTVSLGAQ